MAFEYSALSAVTSKRLLRVPPGHDNGVHVELYEETGSTPYRCLSYTWGDPAPIFEIHVNGYTMQVGRNLYEFLIIASKRFTNEQLWIDAICINQNDDQEKSLQVQRMGMIFKNALEVLIWLGDDPEIARFLDWIRRPERRRHYLQPKAQLPPHLHEAAERTANHPYWQRTWIMQEVFLASSLRILCNLAEAFPDDFRKYPRWHKAAVNIRLPMGFTEDDFIIQLKRPESNLGVAGFFSNFNHLKLDDLTAFWTTLEKLTYLSNCRDSRDKIYSILAITGQESSFRVDYSESLVETFQRSAIHFNAWSCPLRLHRLWHVLGLTKDLVLNDNAKGQHLRCDLPVRYRKIIAESGPRKTLLLRGVRRLYCEQESLRERYLQLDACQKSDLLLCPLIHHDMDCQSPVSSPGAHFLLQWHKAAESNRLQISICNEIPGWFMPKLCPIDPIAAELWYIVNGEESKVSNWDDAVRLCETASTKSAVEVEPQFVVKLSQEYVFFCANVEDNKI